jgi:TRAP-type C4-dicarboxylate transport system substrate-binding protein
MSRLTAFGIALLTVFLINDGARAQQTLRFASFGPPTSYFYVEVVLPWAAAVSRDSQGTVEIKHFFGGSLANAGNMLDRVKNDVADLGWGLQGLAPQVFLKTTVVEVPFAHATSEEGALALWHTLDKGVIASDYEGLQVFGTSSFSGSSVTNRTRPIRTLEDLKGLKLTIAGRGRANILSALGGVALSIPIDEVFLAMERGTVDGTFGSLSAVRQFKFYEVAKYYLDESFSGSAAMLFMSKHRFDSLPEPARAAFRKHSGEQLSRALGISNDGEIDRVRTLLGDLARQGKVMPIMRLSDDERARWRKTVEPVIAAWVQNVPDGQRVLDAFRAEVDAVRASKRSAR